MKNYDSHIYLYAKNWYAKTNPIDDLKILYGKRNGLEPEHVSMNNILSCLFELTLKHLKEPWQLKEFITDISPDYFWKISRFGKEPWDYWKAVISKCLSVLSLTKVSDIENGLDETDFTILPKRLDN